jgi:transketolase
MNEENNNVIKNLEEIATEIRKNVVKMTYKAGSGHPGGSLSVADIISALYFNIMNVDPKSPKNDNRDRLVLSKGHSCPALYAALSLKGFFPIEELSTLREIGSILQGHPDMKKTPGVDMTTGSLGQGLSAAVGIAMAQKIKKLNYYTYCILGCGELQEGQIWEAAMAAANYKLENLIAIIDYNRLQIDGKMEEIMEVEPILQKWLSFNWHTIEIDGHNFSQILSAIKFLKNIKNKPKIIIAHTIKGKGCSLMENKCEWHGKVLDSQQIRQVLKEF